ncbi:MAG TPA: glycosyl hydrolase family 18 protein [Candidatus Paceibacterota bacterium]|nr:glycosyl hydrolase family 18 protein [Candidatus Paceibacterota bacterium]
MSHSLPVYMKTLLLLLPVFVFALGASTARAAELEYSGWIPYWAAKDGANDARRHIKTFAEVNPFTYTLRSNGTLNDAGKMDASHWKRLISTAQRRDVRVVPTIMSSDGATIDRILRDPALRQKHINEITELVEDEGYDGIDIDYESKWAETKLYFSLFLAELKVALGDKWLSCTIEPRTPVPDRYTGTPPAAAYIFANDFPTIGSACDSVRLMTYDQQTIDQKLNPLNADAPYIPLADPRWTEKVVELAALDIPKDKLVIGVATYGREWDVTVSPAGKFTYKHVASFNPGYVKQVERKYRVKRSTNSAGEQSVTFLPRGGDVSQRTLADLAPSGTPKGELVAQGAKVYARLHNEPVTFRFLSWSDAGALAGHVSLAERLGVRGIAVFKIDGSEDKGTWSALK